MKLSRWTIQVHPWIKQSKLGKVVAIFYLQAAFWAAWLGLQAKGPFGALAGFLIGLIVLQIAVIVISGSIHAVQEDLDEDRR